MPASIKNKGDFVYKSNYLYIILTMYRPGAVTFMTKLEHEFFPPHDQKLNDLYTVHFMKHEEQPYVVLGVPMEYLEQCKNLAEQNCLKLVNGTPVTTYIKEINDGDNEPEIDQRPFPIHHSLDLTYTLENLKSYEAPERLQKALQIERNLIQRYLQLYYAEHPPLDD